VWIVGQRDDAVDVCREPSADGYRDHVRRRRGDDVAPAAFPGFRLSVDDLLGAPSGVGDAR
jgi:Uma2 family endonuclease